MNAFWCQHLTQLEFSQLVYLGPAVKVTCQKCDMFNQEPWDLSTIKVRLLNSSQTGLLNFLIPDIQDLSSFIQRVFRTFSPLEINAD